MAGRTGAQYRPAMADYERSVTLGVTADAAFAFLADPANLAEFVPPIAHVESIAVSGDPAEAAEEGEAEDPATEVRFLPDAGSRRVESLLRVRWQMSAMCSSRWADWCRQIPRSP